jgi:hypothetical protein
VKPVSLILGTALIDPNGFYRGVQIRDTKIANGAGHVKYARLKAVVSCLWLSPWSVISPKPRMRNNVWPASILSVTALSVCSLVSLAGGALVWGVQKEGLQGQVAAWPLLIAGL